jgi:hypothetical protein
MPAATLIAASSWRLPSSAQVSNLAEHQDIVPAKQSLELVECIMT